MTETKLQKLLRESLSVVLCSFLVFTCFAQNNQPIQKAQNNSAKQILLNVTITNKQGQILKGLSKDTFALFENDKQQKITFFDEQDLPVSIGFVIDISGSMKIYGTLTDLPVLEIVKKVLPEFVKQSNSGNEYFLMTFNKQTQFTVDWTQDRNMFTEGIKQIVPAKGATAFYDACAQAVEKMVQSRNRKKAIIIFTDGQDNASISNNGELKKLIQKTDVIIYLIDFIHDNPLPISNLPFLKEIIDISGGEIYAPANEKGIADAFEKIVLDIKNQYSVGFRPAMTDTKWHSIKVKLSPVEVKNKAKPNSPPQKITPIARTRKGYFAN